MDDSHGVQGTFAADWVENNIIASVWGFGGLDIELIEGHANQLSWKNMERLVAGMLKAMGYCTRVTPEGPAGGRDVIAHPGAMGLESPRIVAEVKQRKGPWARPQCAHL